MNSLPHQAALKVASNETRHSVLTEGRLFKFGLDGDAVLRMRRMARHTHKGFNGGKDLNSIRRPSN